jgi:hypothetical protein
MDLLTTYTHHSELQVITAVTLISTLYKSLHAKSSPACSVFTSRCLVTALNSGDSSASALMSSLSGECRATEMSTELQRHLFCLHCRAQLSTDWVESSLMLPSTISRPVCLGINHPSGAYNQIFIYVRHFCICWCGGAFSDKKTGLSFIIAAGPRQRSHYRVRVSWDSRPYFSVSDSRLILYSTNLLVSSLSEVGSQLAGLPQLPSL